MIPLITHARGPHVLYEIFYFWKLAFWAISRAKKYFSSFLSLSPQWTLEPQTSDVSRLIKYIKFNDTHDKDRVVILTELLDVSLFFFSLSSDPLFSAKNS